MVHYEADQTDVDQLKKKVDELEREFVNSFEEQWKSTKDYIDGIYNDLKEIIRELANKNQS